MTRGIAIIVLLTACAVALAMRQWGGPNEYWRGVCLGMISATLIAEVAWKQKKWREKLSWARERPKRPGAYWVAWKGQPPRLCQIYEHADGWLWTDAVLDTDGGRVKLWGEPQPGEKAFPKEYHAYWAGPLAAAPSFEGNVP